MYKLALFSLALIGFISPCFSQHLQANASCASFKKHVMKDLDLEQYGGKWYEYAKYYAIFQRNLGCVTAEYTLNNDKVKVINKGKNVNCKEFTSIEGTATRANKNSNDGQLKVRFNFNPLFAAPYDVIATDYARFAIVFSCSLRIQFLWILLRKLEYYPDVKETISEILEEAGISEEPLIVTQNDENACGKF